MDSLRKLEAYFAEFPSIGPRQAKRFVYFLLHKNKNWTGEFSRLIADVQKEIAICSECFRIFQNTNHDNAQTGRAPALLCPICSNPHRNHSLLMIVSRDIDLEAVEKSGVFDGLYFVLGGTVPILEKEPEKKIRISELLNKIKRDGAKLEADEKLSEIVIAMSANPEGENTGDFVEEKIGANATAQNIKISHLGRGLSTGSELEYSDKDTLKNALERRV